MATKQDTRRASPQSCLHLKPTARSTRFAGKYINLSDLARAANIHPSYASYLISGKRTPSTTILKRLSKVLNMTTDAILEAIDDHVAEMEAEYKRRLA